MKQKLRFTTFLFFLPILQKVISINPLTTIQLDFKLFILCLLVLGTLFTMAIIYFIVATFSWINTDFKWKKLLHCVISFIAIVSIYYAIISIINSKSRRIKNTLQNIPSTLLKRNTELI